MSTELEKYYNKFLRREEADQKARVCGVCDIYEVHP